MDRPQCSDVEKGKIIALRENGLSIGELSASLQKSVCIDLYKSIYNLMIIINNSIIFHFFPISFQKSTIHRWIRRYEMEGQVGKRRRPGGLTKKTTEVQDEEFLAIA